MGFIQGTDRGQMSFWSLEDFIGEESMVRVIDKFIDVVDLHRLGFTRTTPAAEGRPGYSAAMLAKLYLYGYQNRLRSSRRLETEAGRNIEVMWLTESLRPDHKSISEFRRINKRPLKKLFREFVKMCRSWDLVGGERFARDGSKFGASNNKKSNFSRKKLDRRLKDLDGKIDEYLKEMDAADRNEYEENKIVPQGLRSLVERKETYEAFKRQLEDTGENELSTVDPDARLMGNNRGGVGMCYNVQATVDAKNNLIVDYNLTKNPSDQGELEIGAKRLLRMGFRKFTLMGDKGYFNGKCLFKLKRMKVNAIVSPQDPSDPKGQPKELNTDKFTYDNKSDSYTCPAGHILHAHSKKSSKQRRFFNKEACRDCPHNQQCIVGKRGFRTLTRNEFSKVRDEAKRRFAENIELYKLRQQIVEHPFGTVKRSMDGGYFLLRTQAKVDCEAGLLFLSYNVKRVANILGIKELLNRLHRLASFVKDSTLYLTCTFLTKLQPTMRCVA